MASIVRVSGLKVATGRTPELEQLMIAAQIKNAQLKVKDKRRYASAVVRAAIRREPAANAESIRAPGMGGR